MVYFIKDEDQCPASSAAQHRNKVCVLERVEHTKRQLYSWVVHVISVNPGPTVIQLPRDASCNGAQAIGGEEVEKVARRMAEDEVAANGLRNVKRTRGKYTRSFEVLKS